MGRFLIIQAMEMRYPYNKTELVKPLQRQKKTINTVCV